MKEKDRNCRNCKKQNISKEFLCAVCDDKINLSQEEETFLRETPSALITWED